MSICPTSRRESVMVDAFCHALWTGVLSLVLMAKSETCHGVCSNCTAAAFLQA